MRVQEVTPELAESLGLPRAAGALVANLTPGGPADEVGIKQSDVIEAYGGHDILKMRDLLLAVAETEIGQSPNVIVWRNGQELTFAPTILTMPNDNGASYSDMPAAKVPRLPLERTPEASGPSLAPAPMQTADARPAPAHTTDETSLLQIVDRYHAAYDAAANDMAKGAVRPARAAAICSLLRTARIENWTGTVDTLSSTSDGRGVLVIQLPGTATVGTTNNGLSEGLSELKTLIPVGSAVQTQAMALRTGQRVRFSGTFARSQDDCLHETSLTVSGSMSAPEFLFQFSDVRPSD